jgi:hypothetical protein
MCSPLITPNDASMFCQGFLWQGFRRIWWLLLRADTTGMGRSRWRAGFYQVTKFSSFGEGPGAAGGSFEGQHVCGSRLAGQAAPGVWGDQPRRYG